MPWPLLILFALPLPSSPQNVVKPPFSLTSPSSCPDFLDKVFPSSVPIGTGNTTLVNFTVDRNAITLDACVQTCCSAPACSAALFQIGANSSTTCWLAACVEDRFCLPVPKQDTGDNKATSLVLVRPKNPPWQIPSTSSVVTPSSTTSSSTQACEVGVGNCRPGEICVPLHDKSRNGVCECQPGFTQPPGSDLCTAVTSAPTKPPPFPISVAVASKSVQLPQNTARLTAYTVPNDDAKNPFSYEWKLISSPSSEDTTAQETGAKTQTLELSGLSEGVYVWKVAVSSLDPPGYGEIKANVTVLAAKRINLPPKAVIVPATQTVNLPTNKAVVDGATSTDDSGKIASYLWVLDSGPVGYQPDLPSLPTLSLTNLTAGNYTIRLTVTDEEGASDATTATLVVVPDTDYKPKANAGEDKIINLPVNQVMLNGNRSSDDHGIKTWEWTKEKGPDGKELPADISGARTPFMTASNLEEGTYNFLLRVTDEAGQSGEDRVAVYVKPPTNLPPVAHAGPDQTLSLPLDFVTLDGSKSTDDGHITSYLWTIESSPTSRVPQIANATAAQTNVTNLTEGKYVFRLTVVDNSKNNHSDTTVLVIQHDSNLPPEANPGPDQKIALPQDTVTLDGSASKDDLGVDRWLWTRGPSSPAAGRIVGGNATTPVITVTGLVPGTYTFFLTVWDKSEEKDMKSVKVSVTRDPEILSEVEIILNKDLSHLTEKDKEAVIQRVQVMTRGTGTLTVGHVSVLGDLQSKTATVRFKVFSTEGGKRKVLPGPDVVAQLRRELAADPELLSQPVLIVQTRVCQNECGGHGICDQATRRCICQPAWMENFVYLLIWGGESNCSWSVVYVCVIGGGLLAAGALFCCLISCKKSKSGSSVPRTLRRYSRLNTSEPGLELTSDTHSLVTDETDDDSEEEVVFQTAKKGRRLNNGGPPMGNGKLSPNGNYRNGKPSFKLTA